MVGYSCTSYVSIGVKTTLKELHEKLNDKTFDFILKFLLEYEHDQLIMTDHAVNSDFHEQMEEIRNMTVTIDVLRNLLTSIQSDSNIYHCELCHPIHTICEIDVWGVPYGIFTNNVDFDLDKINEYKTMVETFINKCPSIDFKISWINTLRYG